MKYLANWCLHIKMAAVELVSLIGFLGILAVGLYLEWRHLVAVLRK